MDTNMQGGVGGFLKRKIMNESGTINTFTARTESSRIAFGHTFPGHIIPLNVEDSSIICQKRAYLCSTENVELEMLFSKN